VAGQQVRCDLWFPHELVPLAHSQGDKPPVLVMTSSRSTSDLNGGM
jgi:hypothetical protein